MGQLNPVGMEQISINKEARLHKLEAFLELSFDSALVKLREYNNEFEFALNRMYLVQGMSSGCSIWAWACSCALRYTLPTPGFINSLLSFYLYLGVSGAILEHFSIADFHAQLQEMKTIYNYMLKNGLETYQPSTDNSNRLKHPEVQRLISLLAPLCTPEFMVVWPRATAINERRSQFASLYAAGTRTLSLFTRSESNTVSEELQLLKAKVEKGQLTLSTFDATLHALRYFATDSHFKEIAMSFLPLHSAQEAIANFVTPNLQEFHW